MTKWAIKFFTIADYEDEEIWLREQHNKGWSLVKLVPPCFYLFEACEPEDFIYRLDFKEEKSTYAYKQMLIDFGWEYIGEWLGWHFIRKNASAAESEQDGEIFSDDESRVDMVESVLKKRFVPLAVILFFLTILNISDIVGSEGGGSLAGTGVWIVSVIYIGLVGHTGLKLKRIRDRYDKK